MHNRLKFYNFLEHFFGSVQHLKSGWGQDPDGDSSLTSFVQNDIGE